MDASSLIGTAYRVDLLLNRYGTGTTTKFGVPKRPRRWLSAYCNWPAPLCCRRPPSSTCSGIAVRCSQAPQNRSPMLCVRCGGAPLLLLALSLSLSSLAAGAPPAPQFSQQLSQSQLRDAIGAAEGDAPLGVGAAGAAAGGRPGRSLLKKAAPPPPKPPLPNFEIGVPAPPKPKLKCAVLQAASCWLDAWPKSCMLPKSRPPTAPKPLPPPPHSTLTLPDLFRREWQGSAVRERRQQLSSSIFLIPKHPGKDYVALCVIARDAHADVLEWLNHHIRCGAWSACPACMTSAKTSVRQLKQRAVWFIYTAAPLAFLAAGAGWAWARCTSGTTPAIRPCRRLCRSAAAAAAAAAAERGGLVFLLCAAGWLQRDAGAAAALHKFSSLFLTLQLLCRATSMPAWWNTSTSQRCSTPAASRRCMRTMGEHSTHVPAQSPQG